MIYTHVVAAILAGALAATGAWRVQEWRYAARDADLLEAAQETTRLRARVADKASESHEVDRVQIKTEFVVITSEVEKIVEVPLYRNVCFDAVGMRALAAAVGHRATTGEPAPALPGSAAAR